MTQNNKSNVKFYAVTGGIGSGKSTIMEILASLGYRVISCDQEIKYLYTLESVKDKLKAMFPNSIKNGELDKKEISNIVFRDKEALEKLNSFLHPLVMERCFELAKKNNEQEIAFIEVPLLFESNLQKEFDGVIVVRRKIEDRIKSVEIRSNLTETEVMERIDNQVNYDKIELEEYIIIDNDEDKEGLKSKLIEKIQKL